MQIIRHGRELQNRKEPIVIYGGGTRGRTFYEEIVFYMGVDHIFLCDQDQKVCRMYRNYVYLHDLEEFFRVNVNAVIVITIENPDICKKIYDSVNAYCGRESIYRYIPETTEEWKNRKLQEGFFNGEKNVFVQSDHESKLLLEALVREKSHFFLHDGVLLKVM